MTLSTRRALLAHKSSAIRACAAISEWVRSNNTLPPDELLPLWREAVTWVFNEQDQYQLRLILEAQPDLAFPWFVNVLAELKSATWQLDESLAEVVPLLTREQRATILHSLTASTYCERFFDALIADDLVLFGEWIDQCEDRRLVSLPLHRRPTEQWVRLACVALDHGFMQSEIARFCTAFGGDGWEGPNSVHYEEVHQEFATLLEHPDIRLHEAARRGMKITQQLIEDARADEQHEAVHGMMAGRRRTRAIRKARAI